MTEFNGIKRRTFLKAALAGTLASPAVFRVTNAQGLEKVRLTLPWLPQGSEAYAYAAKAKGFWRQRGLDVELSRGYGSIAAITATMQGNYDAAIANASALVLVASRGAALNSIAMLDYDPGMGIAVLKDSPLRTPKDLEGKKVGQTVSSADAAFFAPFCDKNGVDIKKVDIQSIDPRVRNSALIEGRLDAATGFASSFLASTGPGGNARLRFMNYVDYGLTLYGNNGLLVPPQIVANRAEYCQNLTDGLMEGLRFALTNFDETRALFLEAVSEMRMMPNGAEFARIGMAVQSFAVLGLPDAKVNGFGWSDPQKLGEMAKLVMRYQGAPDAKLPDVEALFTNRFAGRVKLTEAEWDKAAQSTLWIEKQMRKNT